MNKFSIIKAFQFGGIANTGVDIQLDRNSILSVEPNAFEGKTIIAFLF